MKTHFGTCHCGQLNLTFEGEIKRTSICHCLSCQKRTGSIFGVQTRVAKDKTTISGKSNIYKRTGDEGSVMSFHFCPDCGSTVYWEAEWLNESFAVPIGIFGDPTLPTPVMQIYGNRKHHWVTLPDSTEEYMDEA